jgi:hypothetical protein
MRASNSGMENRPDQPTLRRRTDRRRSTSFRCSPVQLHDHWVRTMRRRGRHHEGGVTVSRDLFAASWPARSRPVRLAVSWPESGVGDGSTASVRPGQDGIGSTGSKRNTVFVQRFRPVRPGTGLSSPFSRRPQRPSHRNLGELELKRAGSAVDSKTNPLQDCYPKSVAATKGNDRLVAGCDRYKGLDS